MVDPTQLILNILIVFCVLLRNTNFNSYFADDFADGKARACIYLYTFTHTYQIHEMLASSVRGVEKLRLRRFICCLRNALQKRDAIIARTDHKSVREGCFCAQVLSLNRTGCSRARARRYCSFQDTSKSGPKEQASGGFLTVVTVFPASNDS